MLFRRRALSLVSAITLCFSVLGTRSAFAESGEALLTDSELSATLAVGGRHACVVIDGAVYCWGDNTRYQLGTTQGYPSSNVPVQVEGIENAVAVTAGFEHSCALLSDATVKCWGSNQSKQLGRTGATSAAASLVTSLTGVIALTSGNDYNCALIGNPGGVKCWGYNTAYGPTLGRLSVGADIISSNNPADPTPDWVNGLSSGVIRVVAGNSHACAVLADETMKCWGSNFSGQLGTQDRTSPDMTSPGPVDVVGVTGVKALAVGDQHTCAMLTSTVKCWGSYFEGELGAGTIDDNEIDNHGLNPNTVVATGGSSAPLSGVASVSAGNAFSCAAKTDGTAVCWGTNGSAQLGSGSGSGYVPAPVAVTGISDAVFVATGMSNACSISAARVVKCWGSGTTGQIGNGASENSPTPVAVSGVVAQTITFGELSGKSVTDASFTVSATASSGGAVSFESTTTSVCTVSGATVTLVAPGTCTISASRASYGLYKAATAVTRSFTVTGLKPTVKTGTATPQSTKATLRGTVNAGGTDTAVNFVYGTDPSLSGGTTVKATSQSSSSDEEVLAIVTDLKESTKYYFRIEASNAVGSAAGDIGSFTTIGPEGVSINDGDEFTNSTSVVVSVVGPSNAAKILVSNDGGFKNATPFDLTNSAADVPWKLVASRSGTFTKTVYVRFLSRFDSKVTDDKTDDIILDTSKPKVATVTASASSAPASAVTVLASRMTAKKKKVSNGVKLGVRATDTISGAVAIEVRSSPKKSATVIKLGKAPSKVKTVGMPRLTSAAITVKSTAKALQIRAVDGAGNKSAWVRVVVKR